MKDPSNEPEHENASEPDSDDDILFNVAVDGSGGDDFWGIGLLDQPKRKGLYFGGRCMNLGVLRAMGGRCRYCDAHICEALALYFGLSYARQMYGGRNGCGIVICDRTALLTNAAGSALENPVFQMAVDFVLHQMAKALDVFSSIRFVQKRCHGHKDSWTPDKLSKTGRKCAASLDAYVHVPCPLRLEPIQWVNVEKDANGMITRATIKRAVG